MQAEQQSGAVPDRDTVIAMAIKAGFNPQECLSWQVEILRLAALVAAQERESCAKVCETGIDDAMEAKMLSKSQRLAGKDGELEALKFWSTVSLYNNARKLCAEAIRARKEET